MKKQAEEVAKCNTIKCDCEHKHQDEVCGNGRRYYTVRKKGTTSETKHCTVCGSSKGGK